MKRTYLSIPVLGLIALSVVSMSARAQTDPNIVNCIRGLTLAGVSAEEANAECQSPNAAPAQQNSPSATNESENALFSDIEGTFAQSSIEQLVELEVIEPTSEEFRPSESITRAEFVRWLVEANNAIWFDKPQFSVRLAEGGGSDFSDVPTSHPDFAYIQGAANAGLTVGYEDGTFRPDSPLTREELIAIKVGLDGGGIVRETSSFHSSQQWTDLDQISQRFVSLFNSEGFNDNINIQRTFGAVRDFRPQAEVTRAEAAIALTVFGNKDYVTGSARDFLEDGENRHWRSAQQALMLRN